jgi:ribosomal protein S12 methylthiotransferase accessory factor
MSRLVLAQVEPTPLAESLPRLKSLASPLVGLVSRTDELLPGPDDARLFHVTSTMADSRATIGASSNRHNGGIHPRRDAALAAAIGEGIERYAGAHVREGEIRWASARDLGAACARPASFALFHRRQYAEMSAYVPFEEETRLRWTPAFALPSGEPAFVPTQLVSLVPPVDAEPRIGYATSSGMACGATREEAILSALLELVERDAFSIAWYNALSLPRVDLRADRILAKENARFFDPAGITYTVVDLSAILTIPTALAVCRDAVGKSGLAVGCASAPTMRDAVRKALREAFQTRVFARQLRADAPGWSCADVRTISRFEEHVLYYALPENARRAAFIDAASQVVPLGDIAALPGRSVTDHIHAIVAKLAAVGVNVFVVETTPVDVAAAGLHTVAVVAPELCRIDVTYAHRYLGGRRLYDAAWEAGLVAEPFTFETLNPLPHPFP